MVLTVPRPLAEIPDVAIPKKANTIPRIIDTTSTTITDIIKIPR